MGRIWAICRLTVSEAIRKKIAIVFIFMMMFILVSLPFVMRGDDTLRGRVQTYLAYSLSSMGFLLSMLTILLACGSVALEIKSKKIQLIGTKPVPRWQLLLGKWLGIVLLDLVLLVIGTGGIYGMTRYLASLPGTNADDKAALFNEVLTARAGVPMEVPDFSAQVARRFESMREEGRIRTTDETALKHIKLDIELGLIRDHRTVAAHATRVWEFHNLLVKREPGQYVHLRYRLRAAPTPPREMIDFFWVVGDRTKGTGELAYPRNERVDRVMELPIPTELVADDGTLRVALVNVHPDDPKITYNARISFEEEDKPELLYVIGTFGGNLIRAVSILYCRLLFLAAAGICASTYLGFPVACLVCIILFLAAIISGFIIESMEMIPSRLESIDEPLDYIGYFLRPIAMAVLKIVPQLSLFNPVPTLVDGRAVTLIWVLDSIGKLVLLRATALGLLAFVLFQRRELADTSAS